MIILYAVLIDQVIEVALELQERAFTQDVLLTHEPVFPYEHLFEYGEVLDVELKIAQDLIKVLNLNINTPPNTSE